MSKTRFHEPTLLVREIIERDAPLGKIDYVEFVDAETMQPIDKIERGEPARLAAAVYFGKTRLIDNVGVAD